MFTTQTGVIIPTRNRVSNLLFTLNYFFKNKINFYKIVVVDSSDKHLSDKIISICSKFNVDLFFSKPSASAQRNIGLKKLIKYKLKYIMFLDDDLKFYRNSFKIMDLNIKKNQNYAGYCFNYSNFQEKNSFLHLIKTSKFIENIGLYGSRPGLILDSGWHTKINSLKKNITTQWLPTSCSIYKKKFIIKKYFNKSFGSYSYLEDLDFSLQINPKRLDIFYVVAGAKFLHLKSIIRTSYIFGYYEFLNRYKIVEKFDFKKKDFFKMAFLKVILTIFSILINYKNTFKLFGNIIGLVTCLILSFNK